MSSGRLHRRLSDPTTHQEVRGARVSLKNGRKKKKTKKEKNNAVPQATDADEGFDDGESMALQDIPTTGKETAKAPKVNQERNSYDEDREFEVRAKTENEISEQKKMTGQKQGKNKDASKKGERKSTKGTNEEKRSDTQDTKVDNQGSKAESHGIKASDRNHPLKSSFKQKSEEEDVPDGTVHRKSVSYSNKGDETFLIPPRGDSDNSLDADRLLEDEKQGEQEPVPKMKGILRTRKDSGSSITSITSSTSHTDASKRDSIRSIASSYMDDVEDDDDLSWLKQLLVIKILFVDIFCSMGDHITDFLQGFNLMFDFSQWSNPCLWLRKESWEYGALILAINWSPGFVAAMHLLAYHRKEVAGVDINEDEPDSSTMKVQYNKRGVKTMADEHSHIEVIKGKSQAPLTYEKKKQRWKKFVLTLLCCLLFYPIVPALAYFKILWWWNVRDLSSAAFHRAQRTAHVAHSITGGFEAPVQLILTLWLIMRGVFDNPISTVIKGDLPKDRFGNNIPLPAIPLLSIVFSIFSIILASIRLNLEVIPLPKQVKISKKDWFRLTFTPALSRIPFFLCSILFKISSFAFQWIFLDLLALVPCFLIWFANLCIGYYFYGESKLPKKLKRKIQEVQDALGSRDNRTEQAVWLSSFIGLFLPCCYSQNLDTNIVENMEAKDYKRVVEYNKEKQNKILRCQQFIGTSIHLFVISAVWILVNFDFGKANPFKYNFNKFTQNSFNIFSLVMMTSALMNLGFCLQFDILNICGLDLSNKIDYESICHGIVKKEKVKEINDAENKIPKRKIFKEKKNPLKQVMLILLGVTVVVLPFVLGYAISYVLPQDNGFIIIRPDPTAPDDKMIIRITKMFSVNYKAAIKTGHLTGLAVTCKHYNNKTIDAKSCPTDLPKIVILDFQLSDCYRFSYDTTDKIATSGVGAMILLENWKNRATSPYPKKIGETYMDFSDNTITFPIVTIRNPDVKNFQGDDINCKEVTIVFDHLENELENEDSKLFEVDCDLLSGSNRIAWRDDTPCPNNKNNVFFAEVSEETAPIRCIDVEIKCYDKGLKCNELVRFQDEWDDKQKGRVDICQKAPPITEKPRLHKIANASKHCKSEEDIHFQANIPLVCKERNQYHTLNELLCSDAKYVKTNEKFWFWGDNYPENICCNGNKNKIMYSEECKNDLTTYQNNQTKGWSERTHPSTCKYEDSPVLGKKSYRFKKFKKGKIPGCILIEETQEWCEGNGQVAKSEFANDCERKDSKYRNVPKCGY